MKEAFEWLGQTRVPFAARAEQVERSLPRYAPFAQRVAPVVSFVPVTIRVGNQSYSVQATPSQINAVLQLVNAFTRTSWPSSEAIVTVDVKSRPFTWSGRMPNSLAVRALQALGLGARSVAGFAWLSAPNIPLDTGKTYRVRYALPGDCAAATDADVAASLTPAGWSNVIVRQRDQAVGACRVLVEQTWPDASAELDVAQNPFQGPLAASQARVVEVVDVGTGLTIYDAATGGQPTVPCRRDQVLQNGVCVALCTEINTAWDPVTSSCRKYIPECVATDVLSVDANGVLFCNQRSQLPAGSPAPPACTATQVPAYSLASNDWICLQKPPPETGPPPTGGTSSSGARRSNAVPLVALGVGVALLLAVMAAAAS